MRVRLRLLLPLGLALLVAAAFLAAALVVGGRDGAAAGAVAAIGAVFVLLALILGWWLARLIADPLSRLARLAPSLGEQDRDPAGETPVVEVRDAARAVRRTAGELRDRHRREVRQREELAALVEAVSEGILQIDADRRVVRLNRAARTLLALPEEATGRSVGTLTRNAELRRLFERGAAGERIGAAEVLLDERRLLVSVAPGRGGGAVATFVDLTDLRRLEEVRRDFVANASHELKTPLTSIRGYTETLLSGDLPPTEQRQFLRTIVRNAERLQRIVDDLLDLSRLESGRWKPELEPVNVAEVAGDAWAPFASRDDTAAREFDIATEEGAAVAVADRRALEQVFANLFDNALRYTPGPGRIRVSIRPSPHPPGGANGIRRAVARDGDPAPGWIVVEVRDTGAGIPRDALPRVFERFYRVDPARSRAEGGTGLGLSIVKHMIESMGGGITAESELGKGTTIRFWLPSPGSRRYPGVTAS